MAPLVPQFAARYPAVQLYLGLADRGVNLIEECFDVAVRIAELLAGSLVSLLPGYSFDGGVAIYAVYPHRRHLPAKTRAFIDFLASSFSNSGSGS